MTQLSRVRAFMHDGEWRTLAQIAEGARPASEAGVSARLRELRAEGLLVECERVASGRNLRKYRVRAPEPVQQELF